MGWCCETFLGRDEMSSETRGRKFFLRYRFVLAFRHGCCERLLIAVPFNSPIDTEYGSTTIGELEDSWGLGDGDPKRYLP